MTRMIVKSALMGSICLAFTLGSGAQAPQGRLTPMSQTTHPTPTIGDIQAVSPALAKYTSSVVRGEIWNRPDLSKRDRSMVTLAALIARDQAAEMPSLIEYSLDNGVKPSEVSEIITHLSFYTGWPNGLSTVSAAKVVFAKRGIKPDQLPAASGGLLPIDEAAETRRATRIDQEVGSIAPGVVQYTSDLLFHELWLRPALAPRDRSLITVSALIAGGQLDQLPAHLNRAMDNGLTKAQVSEVLTQLAFYAGWPKVFSAIPVVKRVIEAREK